MGKNEQLEQELEQLRRGWKERLAQRLSDIERAATPVLAGSAGHEETSNLRLLLHRLTGSGASFGYPAVSRAAGSAEDLVKRLLAEQRPPSAAEIGLLKDALLALAAAAGDPPAAQ